MFPIPVSVRVGKVPMSPVIFVELTAPAVVIPLPASTAKVEAVPSSTGIGILLISFGVHRGDFALHAGAFGCLVVLLRRVSAFAFIAVVFDDFDHDLIAFL